MRCAPALSVCGLLACGAARGQSNVCGSATPVGTGVFGGTTVGMSADGAASCGVSAAAPDVWFSFTPVANATLIVDTCGSGYDTVLSVHTACPGTAANELACDDDGCGPGSAVRARVAAGSTYFIRVSGYNGATGPFVLHVSLGPTPLVGPDVWVSDLTSMSYHGAVGGVSAYAVGTVACNQGDAGASWVSNTAQHPVIAQNMYRLSAGRFEQIGQSWVKHGFNALNQSACGACGGGSATLLGVNCSQPYAVAQNAAQSNLGPRSQVNGTTGVFAYPFTAPPVTSVIDRRIQAPTADIDPALNAGALYFVEAHYVAADDAAAGNGLNNATYRPITIVSATAAPTVSGAVHAGDPAIKAWREADPGVALAPADYAEGSITARFWVGGRATDRGGGVWTYEYAVYNQNAARNGGVFSVPVGAGVAVSNIGFHAPLSHSGEPFDNAAWGSAVGSGAVAWSTTVFAANPNANAIRWGTLYNFRFDAGAGPTIGSVTLGLHSPGSPASLVAAGLPVPGSACYANCDGSTAAPLLTVADFACFLNRFAAGASYANCDGSTVAPVLTVTDFACFLNRFAAGCG